MILSYLEYFGVLAYIENMVNLPIFGVRISQSPYSGHYYDPLSPSEIIFLVCMVFTVCQSPNNHSSTED